MREAGRKIANAFCTFADKPEKEYGEKKFSKTERIKKPDLAKKKLAFDAKQQRMDKAEQETKHTDGADAFEEYEKHAGKKQREKR